jgi:N-acetylglucosamine-6-phosphate deacetylase
MADLIAIRAAQIMTPFENIKPGIVLIKGEKIAAVGPSTQIHVPDGAKLIDVGDKIVVPGFIDTHVHGRDGHRFGEDPESTTQLCQSITSTGTTSLLPTLGSWSGFRHMLDDIRVVRQVMLHGNGGAEIVGIHMEGPYLSGEDIARGSQPVTAMRKPSMDELNEMIEASDGTIRKMTIAPELDGALDVIRELVKNDILPSAGHTTATYETMMEAVEAGLRSACHTFNGMIPLHHRNPGVLGAVLTCDEINAELIPDCQHVYPVAMQILWRCKGTDHMHLVTDNTYWAGLPNGAYEWSEGRTVIKEDQRAYVQGGTLAGSVATMNFDINNMVQHVGCSLFEAVKMASLNPALLIGIADRKGSLEPDKDADLVVIDDDVNVYLTMVKGQEIFVALPEAH